MSPLSLAIAVLFALVAVDRALVWCERRGWIYYRHSRRHSAATALLNIEAFFQPSRQHVIELRQDAELVREEDDKSGSPRSGRRNDRVPAAGDSIIRGR